MELARLGLTVHTDYLAECYEHFHEDGSRCDIPHDTCVLPHTTRLKWRELGHNLVVTEGLNKLLDATLKTGYAAPAWFIGLVNNAGFGAYAAGDTAAKITTGAPAPPGTNNWAEGAPYSNGTRVAFVPGVIAAGSVAGSAAVFNINATLTVRGAFMSTDSAKAGTTGTLYGEGDFGVARAVLSGDTLNVTVTCTVAAA
jgi:hypothetical protein